MPASLLAARQGFTFIPRPPAAPPNLVLRAVPNGALLALARLPLLGPLFTPSATVHGGTSRLYHMLLLPAAHRATCTPACDDAVLLDNLR